MFQREFALRLCAAPGSKLWCRLSANVQMYSRVDHVMKVGKGNFRPPPQVESSVVRIRPHDPPPAVKFEEFDGLNRIVFARMHKTLRACFKAKGVKELVDKNYRTWCAMNERMIEDDFDAWNLIDTILCETLVPAKTLDEDEQRPAFGDSRAATLSGNDLLELLMAFNVRGVHFA
jgi:18S rRNA (adenine1779-N6/adenine1780-N6)-dimethyltransferase